VRPIRKRHGRCAAPHTVDLVLRFQCLFHTYFTLKSIEIYSVLLGAVGSTPMNMRPILTLPAARMATGLTERPPTPPTTYIAPKSHTIQWPLWGVTHGQGGGQREGWGPTEERCREDGRPSIAEWRPIRSNVGRASYPGRYFRAPCYPRE